MIDGTGEDDRLVLVEVGALAAHGDEVAGIQAEYVGSIQDGANEGRVAVLGQRLILVGEVALAVVEAERNALEELDVELARILVPLLLGVVLEDELVEMLAELLQAELLAVRRLHNALVAHVGQVGAQLLLALDARAAQYVHRRDVDRYGKDAVDVGHAAVHLVAVVEPVAELVHIRPDALVVCVEDVRAVLGDADAGLLVDVVVAVAAEVVALLDDEYARLRVEQADLLGHDRAAEARADDHVVGRVHDALLVQVEHIVPGGVEVIARHRSVGHLGRHLLVEVERTRQDVRASNAHVCSLGGVHVEACVASHELVDERLDLAAQKRFEGRRRAIALLVGAQLERVEVVGVGDQTLDGRDEHVARLEVGRRHFRHKDSQLAEARVVVDYVGEIGMNEIALFVDELIWAAGDCLKRLGQRGLDADVTDCFHDKRQLFVLFC